MASLKSNAFELRIWWVKKDIKRIIFLIVIPLLIMVFFPFANLKFFGASNYSLFTQVLLGLFLGLVTFSVCFVIQLKSPDQPDYKQEQRAVLFFSPYLFFVNALAEEFFFRGFIQSLLFQLSFSPVVAITLSSTIFALYHIPMFRWSKEKTFIAFLGGLLFGTTFFFTQSLIIVWFAHGFGDLGLVHEAIGGYFIWTKIRKNRSELYRK